MKVTGQHPKLPVQEKILPQTKEKELGQRGTATSKTEELQSPPAKDFAINRIKMKIDSEPDFNSKKVKELRDKIKNGEYKIDAGKIAKNMLTEALIEDII